MKNNQGFTLIELLVVVLIIGILAGISIPRYFKTIAKTQTSEAMVVLRNIADAQKRYFFLNDNYTSQLNLLDLSLINEDGSRASGQTYTTKNFEYTLTITTNSEGTATEGTIVARPKFQSGCTIFYQFIPTLQITCSDGAEAGLCNSLGLTLANPTQPASGEEQAEEEVEP